MTGPYASQALSYLAHGWPPVPCKPRTKILTADATGYTGYAGEWPDERTVEDWIKNNPDANIALRLPKHVAGIDVDDYGEKHGADTLERLESDLGRLPDSPASSSRDDGISGIYLFKIPDGHRERRFAGDLGSESGIELITWYHRYVVCQPSIHPETGNVYRWTGDVKLSELNELPLDWCEYLDRETKKAAKGKTPEGGIKKWLSDYLGGDMCDHMTELADKGSVIDLSQSRHRQMTAATYNIVGDAVEYGHPGANRALTQVRDAFQDSINDDPSRSGEWQRSLCGAVQYHAQFVNGHLPEHAICDELTDLRIIVDNHINTQRRKPVPVTSEYPADQIDGPLAELIAGNSGLPAALVGGAGLAALSGVAGGARLVMPDGSVQRPVLWIPLLAPSGGGKTPAFRAAFQTISELEQGAYSQYRSVMQGWRDLPKDSRGHKPEDPTLIINDFTMESLARFLDGKEDGVAIVASDELQGFLKGLNQYKPRGGSDVSRMLELWSLVPWRYQRATGEVDMFIAEPCISVCGGLPTHMHNLLGDDDDGMRPRWLPHMSNTDTEWRENLSSISSWDDTIAKLFESPFRRDWKMSKEAKQEWLNARKRWYALSHSDSTGTSVSRALFKADIQAARIALALAESCEPAPEHLTPVVSAAVMRTAIAIADYSVSCWGSMSQSFTLGWRDEALDQKVVKLAAWLDSRDGKMSTRNRILKANVCGVRSKTDLDMLLSNYLKTYPGRVVTVKTSRRSRTDVYGPTARPQTSGLASGFAVPTL
jgi:Bifunctional DNA primase/polymerase, N-terminal/Protein of unknown function (DUF3987)